MKKSVEVVFASRGTFDLDMTSMVEVLRSRSFIIFFMFSVSFFLVVRPYQTSSLEHWKLMTVIIISAICTSILITSIFLLSLFVLPAFGVHRIYNVFILFPAAIFTTETGNIGLVLWGDPGLEPLELVVFSVFNFLIFFSLEFIFSAFVAPKWRNGGFSLPLENTDGLHEGEYLENSGALYEEEYQEREADVAEVNDFSSPDGSAGIHEETRFVCIGNKFILSDEICHVSSHGHYILIVLDGGRKIFLRAGMGAFVKQTPGDLGYQVHRSHWVAYKKIVSMHLGENSTVTMSTGEIVPVSTKRKNGFISRIKAHSQNETGALP